MNSKGKKKKKIKSFECGMNKYKYINIYEIDIYRNVFTLEKEICEKLAIYLNAKILIHLIRKDMKSFNREFLY